MANIWDEYERDLFSEKKKKDDKPASSNIWDDIEQEHFNPKPKAGLTSSQVSSSIDRYQAGLYGVGEAVAEGVGAKDSAEWLKGRREENEFLADKASQRARDLGAVDQFKDVNSLGDFGSYAKGLAIQSLPYAGEALAGGLLARGAMSGTRAALTAAKEAKDVAGVGRAERALNAGSQAGAVAASYPSVVGDVLGNQREQSGGETRGGVAAALAVPYAALNAFGVEGALARGTAFKNTVNLLDRGTGLTGAAARMAATGAGVAFKEGASETGQEMLNQVGRMSVDSSEAFLSAAAQERFKESFIGGAALGGLAGGIGGGWRRSSAGGNDISQAMGSKDATQPDITTTQFTPPPPAADVTGTPLVVSTQQTIPSAPAVVGGTTDIAQAQAQAQAAQQQQQMQEQQQAAREEFTQRFGGVRPALDENGQPTQSVVFQNKTYHTRDELNAAVDKLVAKDQTKDDHARQVQAAFTKTYSTQEKTPNVNSVVSQTSRYTNGTASVEDAAARINIEIATLVGQGKKLDDTKLSKLAEFYENLTGVTAPAYAAAEQAQPTGVNNGRLQLQNDAGIREVPVSGGTTETNDGGNGPVRPVEIQPVGATSVGAGPLDLQAGQPSTGGVRTSTGDVSNAVGSDAAQAQVSEAPDGQATTESGQAAVQPTGQTEAGASVQQTGKPARAAEKVKSDEELLADQAEEITAEVMEILIPVHQRMTGKTQQERAETAQRLRDFTFGILMNGHYDTLAVMADDFGIKLHQAKDWSAKALAFKAEPEFLEKLKGAYQVAATKRGLTIPELLARIEAKANAAINDKVEVDKSISTSREQGGPRDSDERVLNLGFDAEGRDTGEVEANEGLAIKSRKSGESIQERFNAVETNQASVIKILKMLDEIKAAQTNTQEFSEARVAGALAKYEAALVNGAPAPQDSLFVLAYDAMQKGNEGEAAMYVEELEAIRDAKLATAKEQAAKQTNKSADLNKPEKEKKNAVQKRSTKEVPVQERTGDSEALGEGNAEGGQAAAESEAKAEPKQEKITSKPVGQLTTDEWGAIIGSVEGPARADAKHEDISAEDATLLKKMVIKIIKDGVASGKTNAEIVGQIEALTKGGVKHSAINRIHALLDAQVKQEEVKTPEEQWVALSEQAPGMPPYEILTPDEKARWDDLANRGVANLAAANKLFETPKQEGTVQAPVPAGTAEALAPQVEKLTEGQTVRLEKHYGVKRGSSEFLAKLNEDVVRYVNKGAEAVAAAIRDIVKAVSEGVLAIGLVFNPSANLDVFKYDAQQIIQQTVEIRTDVPAAAQAKMSPLAKDVYSRVAPAAVKTGKGFIIADKPNGMIHIFSNSGEIIAQDPALFGKDTGDVMTGEKITPAGKFNLKAQKWEDYAGGHTLDLWTQDGQFEGVAVHAAWLAHPTERRVERLASTTAADNKISGGCINTGHDTFLKKILPNLDKLDGGMIFVLPDRTENTAKLFPAETKVVSKAVSAAKETPQARTVVGKEEEIRLASKSAPSQFMDFDEAGDQIAGLDLVREQLEEAGIGHAVDLVSDWELTNDKSKNAEHGSLRTVQGRYVGTLNMAKLGNANYAAEVARHEIAHAIDMGPHGGIYSAQPEMGVSVVNGKISAEGPVAKELFALYKNDPKWNKFLEYPFDSTKHPELNNRTKVQLELFAQAFSIYTTPEGRAILEAQAPVTAAYFKEVIQDVKSTKPLQIQKAEIAALRAAVLYTRRESKGNRGPSKLLGFDERVDELLASRSSQFGQEVKASGVFAKAGEWLDAAVTSPKETLHKLKLGFLTLDQLAELDKSPNQVVRAYSDVSIAMQMMSKDMVDKAVKIDHLWAKLDPKEAKRLSETMRAATRAQYDPALGAAAANGTEQEVKDLYTGLTNSGRDVYAKVKKYYEDAFNTRLAIMEETAAKLGGKELKEIRDLYSKLKGPYFPLGRTGKYYAVGMSPRVAELTAKKEDSGLSSSETTELAALRKQADQYKTSSFNTLYEAKKAAEQFKEVMGDSYYKEVDIEKTLASTTTKMPNFAKMEEYITSQIGGDTQAQVKSMLNQMMFDMLPEHHALKNQMQREGVYGENEDMRQVFASTSISQAHYISRLKFASELNIAMANIGKAARRDNEMQQIKNELALRTKLSMDNTQSALTDAMVNASYFAHLGLSPAFLLTNMTQVPMITAPWLGARHGVGATKRAMAMALADSAKIITSSFKDGDWRSEINWNNLFPVGSNEDRMFRDLLKGNVLDITMEHDLAAVASAQKGIFDDKISKATGGKLGGMSDVVKLVNTPVRITELANRAVTALSAYRLKMESLSTAPMTAEERHTAAVNYAARAVSETQLNYSEMNAPRHMRQVFGSKPLAKMIFQFRKFQQGMLYLIAKNISDAMPGSKVSKEDRRIARRTIAGLYMTTGLMAGTTGMPLMGTVGLTGILNLIAAAFGDDDEPWDAEVEYRNFLNDWLGKDMALLVAKGLPAYLGADLSQRVGMGDIANPIPFVQRGQTGQSTVANVLYAAGGASVGMAGTMYDGIVAMANGDVMKGMEKVIPVKAVKDALRTYRYADEGMTDKRGNVILAPEKFDAWDLALRGMGFTPTKESEYYAANAAMQGAKTAATDVRTRLLREYSEAKLKGESTEDIDAKIADFNERHPEKTVKIDMSTKLKAVQARRKMAAERNEAGLRIGKNEKPFADTARFATQE